MQYHRAVAPRKSRISNQPPSVLLYRHSPWHVLVMRGERACLNSNVNVPEASAETHKYRRIES